LGGKPQNAGTQSWIGSFPFSSSKRATAWHHFRLRTKIRSFGKKIPGHHMSFPTKAYPELFNRLNNFTQISLKYIQLQASQKFL
jgi:hypothetical protein